MNCKSNFAFLLASAAVSLMAASGSAQCHNGHCNGKVSRGSVGNGSNGGYGINGGGFATPVPLGPPVAPFVNPTLDNAPPPDVQGTFAEPDLGVVGDQNLDVVVEHPLSQRTIKVQTFRNRSEAENFVKQLEKRFWITYSDQSGQPAFREAKTAAEINTIVTELRNQGSKVSNVNPVVARIMSQDDTSLEALLGHESGPIASAPVVPVPQNAPLPTDQPVATKTQDPVDTELKALEGIWAAVARSTDGELRKIELKLDSGGWARLSIPDGAGKTTTIDRRAVVEEGQLKLKDGESEMLLGMLTQVDPDQFVVTRTDGQVTFLKQ